MMPGLALDSPRLARSPVDRMRPPENGLTNHDTVIQRAAPGRWNKDICAGARLLCNTCDVLGGRAAKGLRRKALAFRLPPGIGVSARGGAMVLCSLRPIGRRRVRTRSERTPRAGRSPA